MNCLLKNEKIQYKAKQQYNNMFKELPLDFQYSIPADFVVSIIHDLKNPLSVIRGLGELGKLSSNIEESYDYFNRVITQVDEVTNMVQNLLEAFKPGEMTIESPVTVIQELLEAHELVCSLKQIKIFSYSSSRSAVLMSRKLLKRCFENIITNAINGIGSDGKIIITVSDENDYISITFKDTGKGIPNDIKDNIFKPFVYRREGGTGLGLFTAYHVITGIHKGKIWFESEEGKGTQFYIKMPIVNSK